MIVRLSPFRFFRCLHRNSMNSLNIEELEALLALEQEKTRSLEQELSDLKGQLQPASDEPDFVRALEERHNTEDFFTENNERIVEKLQMAVDSNASVKARVEIDLLEPASAKSVRLNKAEIDPELWKEYEETDSARMNALLRLGALRQQCEHIATVCALFCHRAGTIQLRQLKSRENLPPRSGSPPRAQKRRYSEQA